MQGSGLLESKSARCRVRLESGSGSRGPGDRDLCSPPKQQIPLENGGLGCPVFCLGLSGSKAKTPWKVIQHGAGTGCYPV